jgi:hypothetical protein
VIDAIRVPKRRLNREVFEPWIEMSLVDADHLKHKNDLDAASIVSGNAEAPRALRLQGVPEDLREAARRSKRNTATVVGERSSFTSFARLPKAIRSRRSRQCFSPAGKVYRPVAIAVDRAGPNGPIQTYHITFAEEVTR